MMRLSLVKEEEVWLLAGRAKLLSHQETFVRPT